MRVVIVALLALLPLAASAAEKKNCPSGSHPVFVEPEGKYSGGSELRFGPSDPGLTGGLHNQGIMTLTVGGKIETYYLTSGNGAARTGAVNIENEKVNDEVSFFDRSLNETSREDAAMIYMSWLQVKRTKLLPGSEHIGRVWHFKKCEPAKQSPNAPAR